MWLTLLLMTAPPAHSLDDAWSTVWRRFADRGGRADPDGPLLQRLPERPYVEYEMDTTAASWRLGDEAAWGPARSAARLGVQSIDEFTLLTYAQLRAEVPVLEVGRVGMAYDREQTRDLQSDLLRIDFGVESPAGLPVFARVSLSPRWEKRDSDVELVVGARAAGWGEVRLRAVAFDPFVNAAHALAASRDADVARTDEQTDPPLGFAVEGASATFAGVRGELYAGGLLPASTRVRHRDDPDAAYEQRVEGVLWGALLEWRPLERLAVGITTLNVDVTTERDTTGAVDEALHRHRGYALASLPRTEIEAAVTHTRGSEGDRRERRWLYHLRGWWMPSSVVGAELGVMRGERTLAGATDRGGEGTAHRVTTRLALQLGPRVRVALGVGWDLDPEDGLYDGGGFTMVVTE